MQLTQLALNFIFFFHLTLPLFCYLVYKNKLEVNQKQPTPPPARKK